MKRVIGTLAVAGAVAVVGVAGVVYFGLANVGADDPHSAPVHAFLDTARDRSIEVRAQAIKVPDLAGQELIRAGAGNYDSMCATCHLSPGAAPTELSNGLYPAPPNLATAGRAGNPGRTFWVIKHGIKATGMPAWGKSMQDQYIWEMVAFIQQLPSLDANQYQTLVASSGGHQHGGGETSQRGGHHNDDAAETGRASDQHGAAEADQSSPVKSTQPIHADGKEHVHEH